MNDGSNVPRWVLALVGIAVVWVCCVITSIAGFHHRWGCMPEPVDLVMGNTLLAPLALPKSFGDIVGLTAPGSTRGTLLLLAVFWPAVVCMYGLAISRKSRLWYAAFAIVMLLAAVNWQVVAAGMIGL